MTALELKKKCSMVLTFKHSTWADSSSLQPRDNHVAMNVDEFYIFRWRQHNCNFQYVFSVISDCCKENPYWTSLYNSGKKKSRMKIPKYFKHSLSNPFKCSIAVTHEDMYEKLRAGTLLNRKARPVAPVKRVEMSSARLVRMVSQLAQEKRRVPPMWSKKIRPIVCTTPAGKSNKT